METQTKPHGVRYPWAEWFDKARTKPLTLLRGIDFIGQPHGMVMTVRQAAKRHGLLVRVTVDGEKVTVQVLGGDAK